MHGCWPTSYQNLANNLEKFSWGHRPPLNPSLKTVMSVYVDKTNHLKNKYPLHIHITNK